MALVVVTLLATGAAAAMAVHFWDFDKRRGLELAGQGKFSEAETYLQRALARQPQDAELVRALALGNLAAGRGSEAESLLTRWCELRPAAAEPLQRRMELRLQQRKFPQALQDGEHVLQLEPDNAKVGRQVAPMLLIVGRLEEADRACRHWLALEPQNPALIYLLADVCHQRGNNAESEAVLDRHLSANPGATNALLLRAILYLEADQPQQAIPRLRKVLESRPPPWQQLASCYQLSLALNRIGQTEEATRALADVQWHQALDLINHREQPKFPGLLLRVAEALLGVGRTSEAVDLLGKILADDPTCATEAVRLLEKAVVADPKCVAARGLLADYYEKHGQISLAAEHRRRAQP